MNYKYSAYLLLLIFTFHYAHSQNTKPRHPAEWEEISGVIMEYRDFKDSENNGDEAFDPYLKTALACVKEEIDFYILNPLDNKLHTPRTNIDSIFKSHNINSPYIHIIPKDTVLSAYPWARDHGLNAVYNDDVGDLKLYNFAKDYTGIYFAELLAYPKGIITPQDNTNDYYTDGGNFLTDGHGTFNIAATDVAEDLPTSLKDKYDFFYENFGIQKTLNVRVPFVHIDYFLKLINEETALISYIPNNNYDISIDQHFDHQHYIDKAVISISQHIKSVYGRQLKFISIQNAPTLYDKESHKALPTAKATYINSFILNNTVLVPQYGVEPYDSLAISTYNEAMPAYDIVGVNCRMHAQYSGAIHCLTNQIYADNPIYVKHKWYQGSIDKNSKGYATNVTAKSSDGIKKVNLYWKNDDRESLQSIAMKPITNDRFEAKIPPNKRGVTINYFIEVENNNGKILRKPIGAPQHFYSFTIK